MELKLRPYQDAAATFAYERDYSLILAPVGAGKTAAALTVIRELIRDDEINKLLVIAPLRVCRLVWPREAKLWAPELSVVVCTGSAKERTSALKAKADVVVANYDIMEWLCEQDLKGFDGLLLDELTKLKRPGGVRFKALLKKRNQFKWTAGLTASFTSQGLEDTFGQVMIIDNGKTFGKDRGKFEQDYFYRLDDLGRKLEPKPGALQAVLDKIKHFAYVLEPGTYTDTLPPLVTNIVTVELPPAAREAYKTMAANYVLDGVAAGSEGVLVGKLAQLSAGFLYRENERPRWYHNEKPNALADLLEELAGDPALIIYRYQEEKELIQEWYPGTPCLTDVKGNAAETLIDQWNAGKVPRLLLHPLSGGHGLNLQDGGANIIWTSLDWSFENYEQVIGRLHRSGQKRTVYNHILFAVDTIDADIWAALQAHREFNGRARKILSQKS